MANDKNKIYEQIYFLWKGEGEKHNESIDWYCEKYHVKVEDFRRWYKGISKSVKDIFSGRTDYANLLPMTIGRI